MGYRKIILFGKTAFSITLPQSWVRKNNLQKGDRLFVQETARNTLEVMAAAPTEKRTSQIELSAAKKSVDDIRTLICAAYLNGYTSIVVKDTDADKLPATKKYIQELVAAEVLRTSTDHLEIAVLGDMDDLDWQQLINRVENMTKNMFSEVLDILAAKNSLAAITEREHDIQRHVLFARRLVTCALRDSVLAQKFGSSSLDLHYLSHKLSLFARISRDLIEIAKLIMQQRATKSFGDKFRSNMRSILLDMQERLEVVIIAASATKNRSESFTLGSYDRIHHTLTEIVTDDPTLHRASLIIHLENIIYELQQADRLVFKSRTAPK